MDAMVRFSPCSVNRKTFLSQMPTSKAMGRSPPMQQPENLHLDVRVVPSLEVVIDQLLGKRLRMAVWTRLSGDGHS